MIPAAWRKLLRALHRDAGYLAVGLTLLYAVSGIAVNHIEDWDPNFTQIRRTLHIPAAGLTLGLSPVPLGASATEDTAARPGPTQAPDVAMQADQIAREVLARLGRSEPVRDVYLADPTHMDITLEHSTLYVDLSSGEILEEGQKSRLLLRLANWLHLNRGKKAWTYIADLYAVGLLLLSTTGLVMLPGRKGVWGRGGVLVSLGVAVPVAYVALSGGP